MWSSLSMLHPQQQSGVLFYVWENWDSVRQGQSATNRRAMSLPSLYPSLYPWEIASFGQGTFDLCLPKPDPESPASGPPGSTLKIWIAGLPSQPCWMRMSGVRVRKSPQQACPWLELRTWLSVPRIPCVLPLTAVEIHFHFLLQSL